MKRFTVLFSALLIVLSSYSAKKGYKIQVKINGLKDTTLLLGHHFGNKKYVVDTIRLNARGEGAFTGDSLLDGGIYLVITPSLNYFEIILDKEQEFSLSTDTIDLLKNLKITGSRENQQFNDYQYFMVENQQKAAKARKLYERSKKMVDSSSTTIDKKKYQDSIDIAKKDLSLRDSLVKQKWDDIIVNTPDALLASVLKAMKDLDVPPAPKNEKGIVTDSSFQYRYYKTHFLDNINLADHRLLRTPILESKIDEYLDKVCIQIPDSLAKDVDKVVDLARSNDKVFKYVVQHVFNKYNNPKIMGMDRLFVHISDKYYLSGVAYWSKSDTAFINKLKDRVSKEKPNLIGEVAPELRLFDLKGNLVSLHSIAADYIVLYFFDTECGHCKKIIPEWKKIYEEKKFADKKIVTILVETQVNKPKLQEFIESQGLQNTIVAYDPYQVTNFRNLYDIYSTPVPYVLDKNKKIIAKRIDPETIADFLEKMLERDAKLKKK
jgi:peroxiredoxin